MTPNPNSSQNQHCNGNMWNLLMGTLYSSDSEDSENEEIAGNKGSDNMMISNKTRSNDLTVSGDEEVARVCAAVPLKMTLQDRRRFSEVEKHRIPSPGREDGDGSESTPITSHSAPHANPNRPNIDSNGNLSSSAGNPPAKVELIHLPQTNIRLEKLPPMRPDKVELQEKAPKTPLVQLPTSQPVNARPAKRSFTKDKEPKFVPYEPYKAAVTSMTNDTSHRMKKPTSAITEQYKKNVSRSQSEEEKPRVNQNQSGSNSVGSLDLSKEDTIYGTADAQFVDNAEARKLLLEKDREMAKLRQELAEKEKQLRIQTQVNTEVKRLLVASVGEDIEAKVDFLTQDKARLSADIRTYASKMSRDFEEKEKLSVESNLWKSKFLACSVIVDELARWKASLLHTNEAYEHHVRLALHEHADLWKSLMDTFSILSRLQVAFDPLQKSDHDVEATTLLGLADLALKKAEALRGRLVGETGLKAMSGQEQKSSGAVAVNGDKAEKIPEMIETTAEEGLKDLLSRPLCDGNSDYSNMASLAVTDAAKLHLMKLGDQVAMPNGFKCCTHCQGNVHNI